MNRITIVQHNVLKWTKNRSSQLCNAYQQINPDVILINSHCLKSDESLKIFPYTVYKRNRREDIRGDGVAIAIRNGIQFKIFDDFHEEFLAVEVDTSFGPVRFATGYLPPRNIVFTQWFR